jgi:hypothetical protein
VLSGRGLCAGLITRPEESCRLCGVVVCDLQTSRMRRPWHALGRSATAKKKNPTRCNYTGQFIIPSQLYMFWAKFSSTIRSTWLYWMSWNFVSTHPWHQPAATWVNTTRYVNTVKCSWWLVKTSPKTCRTE